MLWSARSRRFVVAAMLVGALHAVSACAPAAQTQVAVVGVKPANRTHSRVFVQVVNRTDRPMRLAELRYRFVPDHGGADRRSESASRIDLSRDIGPGAAVVVELLVDAVDTRGQLQGTLIAELDEVLRSFPVRVAVADDAVAE